MHGQGVGRNNNRCRVGVVVSRSTKDSGADELIQVGMARRTEIPVERLFAGEFRPALFEEMSDTFFEIF